MKNFLAKITTVGEQSQTVKVDQLKVQKVKKLLQATELSPSQQSQKERLRIAAKVERQLNVHCAKHTPRRDAQAYFKMLKGLVSKDKVEIHKTFFDIQPLPTVSIMNEIKGEFKSVFDPKVKTITNSSAKAEKLNEYCESINFNDKLEGEIFSTYFSNNSAFCVVDLDEDSNPFLYVVISENVILYELNNDNSVEWILYKKGNKKIFLDDKNFIVFNYENEVINYTEHKAKTTLAAKIWLENSPTDYEGGNLDYLLFKLNEMRKMDNLNSSAITFEYKSKCNYKRTEVFGSDKAIFSCDSGTITKRINETITTTGEKCPKCSNDIRGAGTHLIYDPPREDQKAIEKPFGYIFPEVENLKYTDERNDRLILDLLKRTTGGQIKMAVNGQAFNEKQVSAMIENKRNLLTSFGKQVARIEGILLNLIHSALYSQDAKITVSYGNEFFNVTEQTAYELYIASVESDAPNLMKVSLFEQWINIKNKNNQRGYLRDKIISKVIPYYHENKAAVLNLKTNNLTNEKDAYLYFNSDKLIKEYELSKGKIEDIEYKDFDKMVNELYIDLINLIKLENATNTPN